MEVLLFALGLSTLMAIGGAITVWETHAEHTLVLDAAQEAPSIETLSIAEATERGSDRGKIMVSADGAFLSGKLLDAMIAGGGEEYTRFLDAVRPTGALTIAERTERMNAYVDELYARPTRAEPDRSIGICGDHGGALRPSDHHQRRGRRENLEALCEGR